MTGNTRKCRQSRAAPWGIAGAARARGLAPGHGQWRWTGEFSASTSGEDSPSRYTAWIGTAYAQEDAATAHAQWRTVADQLRPKVPKLAALM
ncbi:hypothetical protein E2C06_37065, partial [Dankookia rubra]